MGHNGWTTRYQRVCKVCGKPRYDQCNYALCEAHYLDYQRTKQRYYYHRRKAQAGAGLLDCRPPIPFMD